MTEDMNCSSRHRNQKSDSANLWSIVCVCKFTHLPPPPPKKRICGLLYDSFVLLLLVDLFVLLLEQLVRLAIRVCKFLIWGFVEVEDSSSYNFIVGLDNHFMYYQLPIWSAVSTVVDFEICILVSEGMLSGHLLCDLK